MTSLPSLEFVEENPREPTADQHVSSWALGDQGEWVHAWFSACSGLELLLPRLASFSFSSLESPVRCRAESEVDPNVLLTAYYRAVLPIILQYSEFFMRARSKRPLELFYFVDARVPENRRQPVNSRKEDSGCLQTTPRHGAMG